jgi:uroporphyrinogen III methyltransferase/synthase
LTAYHRDIPTPTDTAWRTLTEWLETRAHAWVLTSSEGIRHLERLARGRFDDGRDPHFPHSRHFAALLRAPVIVPHPRIAIAAKRTGFDTIVTSGAGDDQIVRAALACAHSASDTHGNSSE